MGSRTCRGKVCREERCEDDVLVGDMGRDVKTSKTLMVDFGGFGEFGNLEDLGIWGIWRIWRILRIWGFGGFGDLAIWRIWENWGFGDLRILEFWSFGGGSCIKLHDPPPPRGSSTKGG